ncbi:MAG TPA: hypothetical protein VHM48_01885 [Candidatus Limnocylindrales bacterium]|nr:hypothetical protein [Candidatus Limnocylindrales bacterium]
MAEALRRPIPAIRATPAITRPSVRIGALPTVPTHVGTMLGLSVAGYGMALALVTGLQASSEATINANRAPVAAAIDQIAARHDRLGQSLQDAAGQYGTAAAGYQSVSDSLAGFEDRLAALAKSVTAVDGASRALPASVALPPVVRSVRVTTKAATHATSGGSAAP